MNSYYVPLLRTEAKDRSLTWHTGTPLSETRNHTPRRKPRVRPERNTLTPLVGLLGILWGWLQNQSLTRHWHRLMSWGSRTLFAWYMWLWSLAKKLLVAATEPITENHDWSKYRKLKRSSASDAFTTQLLHLGSGNIWKRGWEDFEGQGNRKPAMVLNGVSWRWLGYPHNTATVWLRNKTQTITHL